MTPSPVPSPTPPTFPSDLVVHVVDSGGHWWTSWLPFLASLIVGGVTLYGIRRSNAAARQAIHASDAREREKYWREQLVAALADVLGVVDEVARKAVALNDESVAYMVKTGEQPVRVAADPVPVELEPSFHELTALLARMSAARFKVELIEPRLRKLADDVLGRCVLMTDAALRAEGPKVVALRDAQLSDVRALITSYRELAGPNTDRATPNVTRTGDA